MRICLVVLRINQMENTHVSSCHIAFEQNCHQNNQLQIACKPRRLMSQKYPCSPLLKVLRCIYTASVYTVILYCGQFVNETI